MDHTIRKYFLFLVIYLFSISVQGQQNSKNDIYNLNQDFAYFKEVLYTSHPATFDFISRDSLDFLFDSMKFKQNDTANVLELEKKVRLILSRIGCIHTNIKNSVFMADKSLIPFKLFATGDYLWIKKDALDSLHQEKDYSVLSINGNSAKTIISKMKNFRASDGYNLSFKYALMNQETWFNHVYQYYFDSDSIKSYTLVSEKMDTIILKRINIDMSFPRQKSMTDDRVKFGKNVTVKLVPENNMAILKIKSFSGSPVIGRIVNKRKYKKALKFIETEGYTNLVVDLRNNTGGNAASGNSLLSFFVEEDHTIMVYKNKGKLFKHSILLSKFGSAFEFMVGNLFASRIPTLKARESKSRVKKSNNYRYNGNVYVLTNGFTLSTASNTASLFKYKTNATLVGSETGGSENNLNAYFYPMVKLPNSQIIIKIPKYRIDLGLTDNIGSGVIPDIPTIYTIQDIKSKKDLEINKIIKLISSN